MDVSQHAQCICCAGVLEYSMYTDGPVQQSSPAVQSRVQSPGFTPSRVHVSVQVLVEAHAVEQ